MTRLVAFNSFPLSQVQKVRSPNVLKEKCISEVVGIGSVIIIYLSKLLKARFSIQYDSLISLVRLQGN